MKQLKLGILHLVLHLAIISRVGLVECISAEQDLKLSHKERHALQQFRQEMVPILPQDYMKQDVYLIKWLRAKNFNLEKAKSMLLENLRWRKEFKMDTILEEDWSDMVDQFEYHTDCTDKQGRPVASGPVGSWNIRRASVSGNLNRFIRYVYKMLEEVSQLVVEQQRLGKQVTRWKMIINMEDFNLAENGCPRCLRAYMDFAIAVENYYTGYADAIIFINAPTMFNLVLDVTRPLISSETVKVLKVFGYDKKSWMKYLDNEISRDQRRPMYGGTMKE